MEKKGGAIRKRWSSRFTGHNKGGAGVNSTKGGDEREAATYASLSAKTIPG